MTTAKICPKCGEAGPFFRNSSTSDGMSHWCKSCTSGGEAGRLRATAREQKRRSTPRGKAFAMWNSMKSRSENKDGKHPAYADVKLQITQTAFITWAIPEIDAWIKANPTDIPSVDRRENSGHYEISNLRIISLSENSRLQAAHKNVHAPNGMAWCGGCQDYLPRYEFWNNVSAKHGLQYLCIKHQAEANRLSQLKGMTS